MFTCPKEVLGLVLDRLSDSDRFNGFGRSCRKLHDLALALPYRRLVITHTDLVKLYHGAGGSQELGAGQQDLRPQYIDLDLAPIPLERLPGLKGGLLDKIDPVFIDEINISTPANADLLNFVATKCKKAHRMRIDGLRRLHNFDFGSTFPTLQLLYIGQMDYADELKFPLLKSLTILSKDEVFDGERRFMMELTPETDHTGKHIEAIKSLESLELGPGFFVKSTAFPKIKNFKVAPTPQPQHAPPFGRSLIPPGRQAYVPPPHAYPHPPQPQPRPQVPT